MNKAHKRAHLFLEDAAVLLEEVLALHAVLAGEGAEHDDDVSAGEGNLDSDGVRIQLVHNPTPCHVPVVADKSSAMHSST